jgi:AcrR family transcriptional regulator
MNDNKEMKHVGKNAGLSDGVSRQQMGRPRSFTDTAAFTATARAIKKHGYSNLTVGSIAKELHCTAPALLGRFGSKSGLLRAFMEWGNRSSADHFQRARSEHTSPLDALRARFLISEINDSHEIGDALNHVNLLAFHVAAWADPDLHDLEVERRALFRDEIISMLEEAQYVGEIAGCQAANLGKTMLAAIAGTELQWVNDPNPIIGERVVEVIDDLVRPYLVHGAPEQQSP